MGPRPSSSELAGEVVAAAKEATASAQEGLVMLAAVERGCARSLGVSGALERPLRMLAGSDVEAASSWWTRRFGMLGR